VTKQDYEARIMAMPAKFGNIAKVYVARTQMPTDYTPSGPSQAVIDALAALMNGGFTNEFGYLLTEQDVSNFGTLSTAIDGLAVQAGLPDLAGITAWILSYNNNKNLVRIEAPTGGNPEHLLIRNLKNYLEPHRLLTDEIILQPGYIINFGVIFQAYAHKHANKQDVKLKCIQKIIDYFNIDKMQFRQPIYISQLEYELMGIDGVRAVDYVCLTQSNNWKETNVAVGYFNPGLWLTEWSPGANGGAGDWVPNGQSGYGYKFSFEEAEQGGVILPPVTPSVFELKDPTINVKGKVL
jgi:hypothetical protein